MKSKITGFLLVALLVLSASIVGCSSKPATSSTTTSTPPTTAISTPPTTTTTTPPTTTTTTPPTTTTTTPPTTTTTTPPTTTTTTPPTSTVATAEISVTDSAISPHTLTIKAGTKVTWFNDGEAQHAIVSASGLFDFTFLPEKSFSYVFNTPGTYTYYVKEFALVIGTITVTA